MPTPPEMWERVDELFRLAVEHAPGERRAFLVAACAGDEHLRREVESLLDFDDGADSFIETPAYALAADLLADDGDGAVLGRRIGPYRLVREVGRGGMGAVYEAFRDDAEFHQRVAIKLVKRGMDTEETLRRFRHERQILATLNHPNIARLLDGGTTADGLPYFVMEYVEGVPFTRYSDDQGLSIAERLELFLTVCSAVQYAHQNLVIHRDLKPGNVLVTAEGVPKLLDFGIAKLLDPEADGAAAHTVTMLGVMTPEYASPEQVRGLSVTTATDVYSLGVLLYELLTGQRPYRITSRRPDEVARVVCEQEPTRPSEAIADGGWRMADAKDSSAKMTSIIRNPKSLKGDLDNIILMTLRKEPERRYQSVAQLVEDLRRYLRGLPVVARKDTFRYRTSKFVRRHSAGVAVAALVFVALVIGVAAVAWQARVAAEQARVAAAERDRARAEAERAARLNAFLQNILGFSNPSWLSTNTRRTREATMADALDEAARRAETELADQPEALAAVRFTVGYTYRVRSRFDLAEPHLRAALDLRRRHLGPAHQDTAQSMVGMAELHVLKGDYGEAEPLFREALAIYRRAAAEGTVDRKWFAIGLGDYGLMQWFKGDLAAAESLTRESLAVASEFTGADRAAVAILNGNLGLVLRDRGDLDGAIKLFRQSIEEHRSLSGGRHFETAISLGNLGHLLMLKGELNQAELLLREAVGIYRETVDETHQYTAYPLIFLADIQRQRGDHRKARQEIERALDIQRRALPEGHIDFARAWIVLGRILNEAGEPSRAEPHLRRALAARTRALQANHVMIAEAAGALGESLAAQKRYAESEQLLRESHWSLAAGLGPRDPRTVEALRRLVALYEAWGKREEAARHRATLPQ